MLDIQIRPTALTIGLILYSMGTAFGRWFCNKIEIPLINLKGKGDVHMYGRNEVQELCKNAGLHMESFEKRGFCRLHCVARKSK